MNEKADYSGMTVNGRLFVAGSMDAFDAAIVRGDREAAIALLVAVDVNRPEVTVDAILAKRRPSK